MNHAEKGKPIIFRGDEYGTSKLEEKFSEQGFKVAVGQRIKVPLLIENHWIGVLTLDNADKPQIYNKTQQELLALFGNQVASALKRAFDQERNEKLKAIIANVMEQATKGDLDSLLTVVRQQLGSLMDVANFMAVMVDPDSSLLDFRINYDNDKKLERQWRDHKSGLVGYLLESEKKTLWLPDDKETPFRKEKDVSDCGHPSRCWLGVPLKVEDNRIIGALVVQHYVNPRQYNENHRDILEAVAKQIARTVHFSAEKEREAVKSYRNNLLDQLKTHLRTLLDEQEDAFWALLMKFISDRCGLRFNRVSVYLKGDKSLRGRAGVGQPNSAEAYKEWHCLFEQHKGIWDKPCNGADFFEEFEENAGKTPTFIGSAIKQWQLSLDDSCWQAALRFNKSELVPQKELILPAQYREGFEQNAEAKCVIVPLKTGDQVLGLLLADNAFNNEPIREDVLATLEAITAYAVGLWQEWDLKRRNLTFDQRQQLNDLRNDTLQSDQKELQYKLQRICEKARIMFEASSVVLYPLAEDGVTYLREHIAQVGLDHDKAKKDFALRPRQHGLFAYVKRTGTVTVSDVQDSTLYFGTPPGPLKDHAFIRDHAIQSFFGIALRSLLTGDPLGVLYINHREQHNFTSQETTLAEEIANIATLVLSAARGNQEMVEIQRAQELNRFRDILETALSPDADDTKVVRALLANIAKALPATGRVELLIRSGDNQESVHEYPIETGQSLEESELSFSDAVEAYQAFKEQKLIAIPLQKQADDDEEIKAERFSRFAIPVYDNKEIIGVLRTIAATAGSFGARDKTLISELAGTAGLVVGSLRRRHGLLEALLEACEEITSTSSLKDTLDTIVAQARKAVPETDSVTVWYRNEQGIVVAGAQSGVKKAKFIVGAPTHSTVVNNIMQRNEPLWAIEATKEKLLVGEGFIETEGVVSTAAFPLLYEAKEIGALFFNYGKPHSFTLEERKVFPIFAAIIATSIRDAQSLEAEKHSTRRLKAALKVAQTAGEGWERQKALPAILDSLREHFGKHLANATPYLFLYNAQYKVLELPEEIRSYYSPAANHSDPVRLSLNESRIICKVVNDWLKGAMQRVINIPDVTDQSKYKGYERPDLNTHSELCARLGPGDKLLGILVLKSDQVNAFAQEDERLFELVAEQVAAALDRAEQVQQKRTSDYMAGAMAWASELAHDINVDIGYIRTRAYQLYDQDPGITEQGKKWAKEIDTRADELKDKARDTSVERTLILTRLDEYLPKKIRDWQARSCPNTHIVYDWGDGSTFAGIYPELLWRAVRHLLRNAIQAMHYGGQIWLRCRPSAPNQIELQIENSGPDIPGKVRQRLFHEPYSSKDKGSGMGVLITKMLIEGMNGAIELLPSQPNLGPVFAIRLAQAFDAEPEEKHDDA
ncbi:MAG: GAF domain-containing protein [Anaerolineae bacterium]